VDSNLLRQHFMSMNDVELGRLAVKHNIAPYQTLGEYGDYSFLRQKVIAELIRIELGKAE
jgi:hypothetical protein